MLVDYSSSSWTLQSRCRLCYKSNNIINSKVNLMVKKLDSKVLLFYIMILHTGILISRLSCLSKLFLFSHFFSHYRNFMEKFFVYRKLFKTTKSCRRVKQMLCYSEGTVTVMLMYYLLLVKFPYPRVTKLMNNSIPRIIFGGDHLSESQILLKDLTLLITHRFRWWSFNL